MRTVENERDLPAPAYLRHDYIRLLSDPRLMIDSKSGELLRRADGERWQFSGWKVTNKDGRITHEVGSCYADHKEYAPQPA